jgi:hypothetical protein
VVGKLAGLRRAGVKLPSTDAAFWAEHVARVETAAVRGNEG